MAWYPEEEASILLEASSLAWRNSLPDHRGVKPHERVNAHTQQLAAWLVEAVEEIRRLRADSPLTICPCPSCFGCCCRDPDCVNGEGP